MNEHYIPAKHEHWTQRVKERVNGVYDFEIDNDFWNTDDDKKLIKSILLESVVKIMDNKLNDFTKNYEDSEPGIFYITTVGVIKFKRNNKIYSPIFKAKSSSSYGIKDNEGNTWVALTTDGGLITLLLFDTNTSFVNPIITSTIRLKQGEVSKKDFRARKTAKADSIIDVDQLVALKTTPKTITKVLSPNDLDYKVRGDYRKSSGGTKSLFVHKKFGTGEITDTISGGMQSRGKWDWIKVRFKTGYKEFTGLYTTTFFLKENILIEAALNNWL